jgi:hypothetical protein
MLLRWFRLRPSPLAPSQVQYVAFCVQYGQLRSANAAVKQFGLQVEFPDVERMHRAKQLEKLVGKGLWGVSGTRLLRLWVSCCRGYGAYLPFASCLQLPFAAARPPIAALLHNICRPLG